jgi:hypothetical protein
MRITTRIATLLPLIMCCFAIQGARATQQVFNDSEGWTVPTGVTSVTVECIGGGGIGGTSNSGAGGGGGGAYARSVLAVVPGDSYEVVTSSVEGRDARFDHVVVDGTGTHFIPVVMAAQGADASGRDGGAGGLAGNGVPGASPSIGDVRYDGGSGGSSSGGRAGGAGGGSAGSATGPGFAGSPNSGSIGGVGGAQSGDSIAGAGGNAGQSGSVGFVGGGAGGNGDKDGAPVGSTNGRVILTW